MCAEALSQAEIDALLRGETPAPPSSAITPEEENTLHEFIQILCDAGKDVFTTLLGEKTQLDAQGFSETSTNTIDSDIPEQEIVVAELNYKGLAQGKTLIVIALENALKLATQMTGGGADTEFGDLEESAFSEAIQSLYSAINTQLANRLGGEIGMDPPEIHTRPNDLADLMPPSSENQILLNYSIQSGSISGPVYQIIPRNLLHSMAAVEPEESFDTEEIIHDFGSPSSALPIMEQPAHFAPPSKGTQQHHAPHPGLNVDITNLDLILDIQLEVKVELGRTHRKIREVLELGPGSVVELNRLAGEPVDILVNDKLFAKGEVVVIDENFGVRITDILSIEERIEALK
ncbi:MAG: flagellar motor switch protein FliN [bacterium]|jgi:flagellar motor switch protein FliN/FliY|nr:flagellar motor switch protein FliN [bacterium]